MPVVTDQKHSSDHVTSPIVFEGRMSPLNAAPFTQK